MKNKGWSQKRRGAVSAFSIKAQFWNKLFNFAVKRIFFVCLWTSCLSWKTSVTGWTFEGPLFGVGSIMNFKSRLASKNLEANLTGCVAPGWKKPEKAFLVAWFCGKKTKKNNLWKIHTTRPVLNRLHDWSKQLFFSTQDSTDFKID